MRGTPLSLGVAAEVVHQRSTPSGSSTVSKDPRPVSVKRMTGSHFPNSLNSQQLEGIWPYPKPEAGCA